MKLKSGVKLTGLQPQMALAALIVTSVYAPAACTITSANDSTHSEGSLHYKGQALDFRTKDYAGDRVKLRDDVRAALGPDFDVVLEALEQDNEHLHVEYDPKG